MWEFAKDDKIKFFNASALKEILAVAIPSVLQQSFISVGNMVHSVLGKWLRLIDHSGIFRGDKA